jgi:hypothetical protein
MRSSDDTKLNWMTQWICYTISMKINFKIALYIATWKSGFKGSRCSICHPWQQSSNIIVF